MSENKQDHNRLNLLRTAAKAFCKSHGVQRVTDFFLNDKEGNTLELECGCRRKERT
jgi:hypothetical protein